MSDLRLAAGANQTRRGARIAAEAGGRAACASGRPANAGTAFWQGLMNPHTRVLPPRRFPVLPPWHAKHFSIRPERCASKVTHGTQQHYESIHFAEPRRSPHRLLAPTVDLRRQL